MTSFSIPSFLPSSSIYEVNIRQFSREGSFRAFMAHIPRLQRMGVDILWLMPIHPIGLINRKGSLGSYYSVKDHKDVNPEFGTRQDFSELVARAHEAGMKVVTDWVANHTAWDNAWANEHPEYYLRDASGAFISPYDWTDAIQLDHASEGEREAMIDAMEYWVRDFDIDGFRADLAHLTPLDFWQEARRRTEQIKPSLIWLGETEDPAYYGAFDINYAWKWMHFTERFVKEKMPVSAMRHFLENQWKEMPPGALQMYFTTNHDENTWNGNEFEKYGVYARALAIASFSLPGSVPMVYGGQEIPFTGRLPFFDKDEIRWPEICRLEAFYTNLFRYRRSCITGGSFTFSEAPDGILAYRRENDHQDERVALNFGKVVASYEFRDMHGRYENVLSGDILNAEGPYAFSLDPGEGILLRRM